MVPDKYVRETIVNGLSSLTGLLVTEEIVPVSKDTPPVFIQITAQSRKRAAVSKQSYEWYASVTITLVKINEKGYLSSAELDDLDEIVVPFMDDIAIPGFRVGFSRCVTVESNTVESPTQTIRRKLIVYEIWLKKKV